MHNTSANDHLVPKGLDTNIEYYIIIFIILYYIYIDCPLCWTNSSDFHVFRRLARLAIIICQSEVTAANLAVADHFDRLRLFDDVHKAESKKNKKK
jgi:hypothetical protein